MEIESVKNIENVIKDYRRAKKRIENKYKQDKKETDTMKKLKEVNEKIAVSDLRIKNLQEELSKVSIKDKDLVEEYANSIKNIEHGYQDEKINKWIKGKDDYLKEKEELEKKVVSEMQSQRKEDLKEENNKELELSGLDGKTMAILTQKAIKIDMDIARTETLLQAELIKMQDFKYEYEDVYIKQDKDDEEGHGRLVKNGEDFKKIQTEYQKLQDDLTNLRLAKKLCEEELDKFKQRYEKKMEDFSKAWNATKNEPGKNELGKNEPGKNELGKNEPGKNEPGKNEPGKNEPGKNEPGKNKTGKNEPGKNEPGKNESRKTESGKNGADKNKWNPELTQEQIDELKAEMIEPGDQEYYMYLGNHGIKEERIDKNGSGKNKSDKNEPDNNKWHPQLTQEQIDELKARVIKPGDQEYYMYLRNHGINEKRIDNNQPAQNGSSNSGPSQNGAGNNGPTQSGAGNNGPTQSGAGNNEPTQSGVGNNGPAQNGSGNNNVLNSSELTPEEMERLGISQWQPQQFNNPNNHEKQWHPQLTEDQINELKAEGVKPGDQEYSKYLKNHGINEQEEKQLPMVMKKQLPEVRQKPKKCSIHIGREGIIEYDGEKYEISKEDIKDGVNVNSFDDEELEEYLRTELSIKNEASMKTIKDLIKKNSLDMTVIHAIFSTTMSEDKKRDLVTRHVNKLVALEQGKEDSSNIDLEYDMESLSKSNLWHRIRDKEVNAAEKMSIYRSAVIAKRHGIATIKGKYKLSVTERIAGWIKRKQNMAFPVKNVEKAHTVALEYNNMAYDKDGNKVSQRELQKKFKERMEYNKELDEYDEDRLSFGEQRNLKGLVKDHGENEEEEEK